MALLTACGPGVTPADPSAETATLEPAPLASEAASGLQGEVNRARVGNEVIALGAVIASSDGILELAVDGMRANNADNPVQADDRWHLGSNTKALTALLYAQLVERDLTRWGATLPDLFPELEAEMDPAWQDITIEDLFAHRSGLEQKSGFWLLARRDDERPVSVQRAEAARDVLTRPPQKSPTDFDYNNLNYIIAGAAMESLLLTQADLPNTWEEAMQALLFDALDGDDARSGFGFGPPPEGLEGHRTTLGVFINPIGRGKTADNPAVLGPAGTLHATLEAHAALAIEFLKDDSPLVPFAVREKLFAPHPDQDSTYAMGWGIYDDPKYGQLLLHSGSNTAWTSQIIIAPGLDRVVIVNVNQFSDAAHAAIQQINVYALDQALENQVSQ